MFMKRAASSLDCRDRKLVFALVGAIISAFVCGDHGWAQIHPPADGVSLPDAYFEQLQLDPSSFQFSRSFIQATQRIGENREAYLSGQITLADAEKRGGIRVAGTRAIPVLAGKYANTAANPYPVSDLQAELFDGPWPTGTMKQYYAEISYGNLTVNGTVFNWVTAPQNDTFYEGTCNGLGPGCSQLGQFLKHLLDANDPSVDFGQYDNDGPDGIPNSGDDDGFVDFAAFVHPESGGECGNSNIWSHRWVYAAWFGSAYTTNDPKTGGGSILINDYVIQPALACDNSTMIEIGVFCHEFGHAFGLPDLYDTDGSSEGIGHWSLMSSGNWNIPSSPAHMCAWCKEQLGWIIPTVVTATPGTNLKEALPKLAAMMSMNNVEFNPEALKLWTNGAPGAEYFLVENRQALGFDAHLSSSGLLIWHIDNNKPGNQQEWYPGLNGAAHYKVALEQADGNWNLEHHQNRGDAGDPFPGASNNTAFNGLSTPNSDAYTAGPTYVAVVDISPSGDPMTAEVSVSAPPITAEIVIWKHPDVNDPNIAEKAQERGLSEAEVRAMLHEPTSHLALAAALEANGKTVAMVTDIASVDLSLVEAVFAVVGAYPNNHKIFAGSPEALKLESYVQGGGRLYLEGNEVWYFDQLSGGHDFGPLFSLDGLADSGGNFGTILGANFAAGMNFNYNCVTSFNDVIGPLGTAVVIHSNQAPAFNCGIAYDQGNYKTIGVSHQFGCLNDGASTKQQLMAVYLDFLGLPGTTPPEIDVSPASFTFTVPQGGSASATMTISNTAAAGAGILQWNIIQQEATMMSGNGLELTLSVNSNQNQLGASRKGKEKAAVHDDPLLLTAATNPSSGDFVQYQFVSPHNKHFPNSPALVALFEDVIPWSSTRNEDVLAANSISYDVYTSASMGVIDLTPYDKVIIASVQPDVFYSALQANASWFENYANAGGFLELHLAPFLGSNLQLMPGLPGGFLVNFVFGYEAVSVSNPDHALLHVPNPISDAQLDGWNYSSHGFFETIPAAAHVIIQITENGEPTCAELSFGAGTILATLQPVEWPNSFIDYHENMILYSGNECSWLSTSPEAGEIAPESSQNVEIFVDAAGLVSGTYDCNLILLSNDPDESQVTVPVQLNVVTDAVVWIPSDVLEPELAKKAAQRGLTIEALQDLLATPTSHLELKEALEANGKSVVIQNTLTATDLMNVDYLFVVLGIYPNNHTIKATDPEAAVIENFITAGGKVYIEGGDVWYFDSQFLQGHNFGPSFGINPLADGENDLKTLTGSCVAAGKDFTYSGQNNFIDRLAPIGAACMIHSNSAPDYNCGVAFEGPAPYRTLGVSFEFGGLDDVSLSGESKAALMAAYLDFFDNGISTSPAIFDFPLANGGWYLISLPVTPNNSSVANLFPTALAAFGWDFITQGYVPVNELAPGQGYWLAMPGAATVQVVGPGFKYYDRTYTSPGWDLLGAVAEQTSPQANPSANIFAMFSYDPHTGSYESARDFAPKHGYWAGVLASADEPVFITVGAEGAVASLTSAARSQDFNKHYGATPPPPPPFTIAGNELIAMPVEYGLAQNYPNPFNPETMIEYQLPEGGKVSLKIYTILGREVRTLVSGDVPAGVHRVQWDGKDEAGNKLDSGVYLYRLQVGSFVQTKKVLLVK